MDTGAAVLDCCRRERQARSAIRILQDRGYLRLVRTQPGNHMFRQFPPASEKFPPAKLAGATGKTCRSEPLDTMAKPLTLHPDGGSDFSLSPTRVLIESTEEEPIPESEIELGVSGITDNTLKEALARLGRAVGRRASN
jgi:hypothetical protein